ncbi:MAG: hypothetical protein U0R64_11195 [Candidatus Nanopelagicales bacterium]
MTSTPAIRSRRRTTLVGGLTLGLLVTGVPLAAAGQDGSVHATTTCPTSTWNELTVAHEILNTANVQTDPKAPIATYKGAGDNPISDDDWNDGYEPPSPYIRNTTRNLQFNMSKFIASPGDPVCETTYITTDDGYTWGAMSEAINAMWPYDRSQYSSPSNINAFYAGNMVTTPPPGVVKVTANYKAQDMEFWANEDGVDPGTPGAVPLARYFVIDQWGNRYIMHASGQDTPEAVAEAFDEAVLPDGWTKKTVYLKKNLFLRPAEGSDGSFHYLVFRDSADNTYHQYKWSDRGALQAKVSGTGMPIWGGQDANVIAGNNRANLIHGAAGRDILKPRKGKDEVWGDQGRDTVVLKDKAGKYTLVALSKKQHKAVVRKGRTAKTLYYVEKVQFSDGTIKVKNLKRRDIGKRL